MHANAPRGYILWGVHPAYANGVEIKLTAGSLAWCLANVHTRRDEGWTLAIRCNTTAPVSAL